jgi:hypothetical protein
MNGKKDTAAAQVPEELVNQFFDRELDEGSRERFFGMLRGDLARCQEVARTQRIIGMLREPIPAPDLTNRILGTIEERKGFLPIRLRRIVTAGRAVAAACVLVAFLGVALVYRSNPGFFRLTPAPQPLSRVIESGKAEASAGAQNLGLVIAQARPSETGVARAAPGRGLLPGRVSVRTLADAPGANELVLPLDRGMGIRFVSVPGGIVDRKTSAVLMLGAGMNPEAIERFVTSMLAERSEEAVRRGGLPTGSGR